MIRLNVSPQRLAALACLLLDLSSCWGLPADFSSLPLEKKVEVYSFIMTHHGIPRLEARSWISRHGWATADLMAQYLEGTKTGLPAFEATEIIRLVQTRGCSLQGTRAEKALEHFVMKEPVGSLDYVSASSALEMIRNNLAFPGGPDGLKGG